MIYFKCLIFWHLKSISSVKQGWSWPKNALKQLSRGKICVSNFIPPANGAPRMASVTTQHILPAPSKDQASKIQGQKFNGNFETIWDGELGIIKCIMYRGMNKAC